MKQSQIFKADSLNKKKLSIQFNENKGVLYLLRLNNESHWRAISSGTVPWNGIAMAASK